MYKKKFWGTANKHVHDGLDMKDNHLRTFKMEKYNKNIVMKRYTYKKLKQLDR